LCSIFFQRTLSGDLFLTRKVYKSDFAYRTYWKKIVDRRTLIMLMRPVAARNRSRTPSPSKPLLNNRYKPGAPLTNTETDDEIDDREVVNKPYPGVDDGFFTNDQNGGPNVNFPSESAGDPDVELIPTKPKEPEDIDRNIPSLIPRLGPDGGNVNPNDANPPEEDPKAFPPAQPEFPQSPGFRPWGFDVELGGGDSIPDLNVYQHKKTLAQGMMDLALFSANANQLRYVLETFKTHPYYYPSVSLIGISLLLQVAVGVGLIWNATYNIRDEKALCVANRVNNVTTICVFFVTVINVFISAFGVAPAPS
ncbi:ninjurin-A, partial [Dendroctonus ponderosae]